MPARLLQINLKFNVTPSEYEQAIGGLAGPLSEVPGHRWTIFLMNENENEAGGIYLFEDEASLGAFLEGPIVAGVSSNPALSDITVKTFGILDEPTGITHGPV